MHAGAELCVLPAPHGDPPPAEVGRVLAATPPGGPVLAAPPTAPGLAMPPLSSLPGATAKLYLDFNGHYDAVWGEYANITTPAFDQDGDPLSFSVGELQSIRDIWAQVAEDFAPFQLDVTTVEPAGFGDGQALRAVIGGNGAWIGPYGGVAYLDAFTNEVTNSVYIFSANLGAYPKFVAEVTSHESGHGFGLEHQSLYDAAGNKVDEYYIGPGDGRAPLMGASYNAIRGIWWYGTSAVGPTVMQDDVAVIARAENGFGLRPDDHGDTAATATPLAVAGLIGTGSGVITSLADRDAFAFATGTGSITVTVAVPANINNLDARLELWDAAGTTLLATADPAGSFGASVTATVPIGTYRAVVSSHGGYGDLGQYTVTAQLVAVPSLAARYLGIDTGTLGNWIGPYGSRGYTLAADATSLPAGVTVRSTGAATWTWLADAANQARALRRASGTGRVLAGWYSGTNSSMTFDVAVPDPAPRRLSLYAVDGDSLGRTQRVEVIDPATGAVLDTRTMDGFSTGAYLSWEVNGNVQLRVTHTGGGPNAAISALFLDGPAVATARYLGVDTGTKGDWIGPYGSRGYTIAADATNLPAGASIVPTGAATWTWQANATVAWALRRASGTGRQLSGWYTAPNGSMTFAVNLPDGLPRRLSLYAVDGDSLGRTQRVEVIDPATGAVLDTRTQDGFATGAYLSWEVAGSVRVRVTHTGGGPNAAVSALFLDGPAPASGRYIAADTATRGDWIGAYGSQGYALVGDATSLPAGVTLRPSRAAMHTWMADAPNVPRALRRASGVGRQYSCWYTTGGPTMTFSVTVPDGLLRRLSVYAVDADGLGRRERLELVDSATGNVLDTRTLENFSGGVYLTWEFAGNVELRVTHLGGGSNAVVSGLFLDGPAPASGRYLGSDATTRGDWIGAYGSRGYSLAGDATSLPSGLVLQPDGAATHTWMSDAPNVPRALQRASGVGRQYSCYFTLAGPTMTFGVSVPDSLTRRLSIYAVDADALGRRERLELIDSATGNVLDSRILENFAGGVYLSWEFSGNVLLRVTHLGGGTNAILSGLFFD
jgi:hypothetical protein